MKDPPSAPGTQTHSVAIHLQAPRVRGSQNHCIYVTCLPWVSCALIQQGDRLGSTDRGRVSVLETQGCSELRLPRQASEPAATPHTPPTQASDAHLPVAGDQGRGRVPSLRNDRLNRPGPLSSSLPSHSRLIGTPLPSHVWGLLLSPPHVRALPAAECVYSNYAFRTGEITTGWVSRPIGPTVRWT